MENININRVWNSSYFNPQLENDPNKFKKFKHSDALFADLMLNTQDVFKIKKIKDPEMIKYVE